MEHFLIGKKRRHSGHYRSGSLLVCSVYYTVVHTVCTSRWWLGYRKLKTVSRRISRLGEPGCSVDLAAVAWRFCLAGATENDDEKLTGGW